MCEAQPRVRADASGVGERLEKTKSREAVHGLINAYISHTIIYLITLTAIVAYDVTCTGLCRFWHLLYLFGLSIRFTRSSRR